MNPNIGLIDNPAMLVDIINIYSHYHNSTLLLTLIPHSNISGWLTATGNVSPSGSSGPSSSSSAQEGGALGMPAVSGSIVSAVVMAVAFVGGITWVIAWAPYTAMDILVLHIRYVLIIIAISPLSFWHNFTPLQCNFHCVLACAKLDFHIHLQFQDLHPMPSYNFLVIYPRFSIYWDYSIHWSFIKSCSFDYEPQMYCHVQLGAECSSSCACPYPLNLIDIEWNFSTHHCLPNWSVAMQSFGSWLMHGFTYPRLIFLHKFIYCLVGVNDTERL